VAFHVLFIREKHDPPAVWRRTREPVVVLVGGDLLLLAAVEHKVLSIAGPVGGLDLTAGVIDHAAVPDAMGTVSRVLFSAARAPVSGFLIVISTFEKAACP